MSDLSKVKVNNTLYVIKDPNARIQLDKLHGIDGIEYNPLSGSIGLISATSTTLGGVKLGSDTQQTVAANSVSTTANRTYAIQKNSNNQLVVNVPWSDSNTDTKVTQSPTSANVNYNILTTTAALTNSTTNTAKFSTKLTYNPSTSTLKNDGCSQVYDSTNKCLKFVFS